MFSKIASFATIALLAVATPAVAQSCSTGSLTCCDSTQTAGSAAGATILKSIGVVVQDVTALVGAGCTPITGVGVSGTSCSAQTVCCDQDSFHGLVTVGCTPVDAGL